MEVSDPESLRPFLQDLGGTFVWRKIAGTDRQSAHSYGVSLDINVKRSHYWRWQGAGALRWQNNIPSSQKHSSLSLEAFVTAPRYWRCWLR